MRIALFKRQDTDVVIRMGKLTTTFFGLLLMSATTLADPIVIQTYPDGTDIPQTLGTYATTPYNIPGPNCDATAADCPTSFTTSTGNTIDFDQEVSVISPNWVRDPYTGATIFGVHSNKIVLTPHKPLGAISFVISSKWHNAGAWVAADWVNSSGSGSLRNPSSGYFPVHQGTRRGVGVGIYARPGTCLTGVTIEPPKWGFGSIRTADCVTSVPEPGSLSLLGLGLLSLGFAQYARRRQTVRA